MFIAGLSAHPREHRDAGGRSEKLPRQPLVAE
jgi:hypothetical protein